MVVVDEKSSRVYKIPVSWMVMDFVEVQADSLEEAYDYMNDNVDDVPLGDEPVYVDGSYEVGSWDEVLIYNSDSGAVV